MKKKIHEKKNTQVFIDVKHQINSKLYENYSNQHIHVLELHTVKVNK